MRQTLIAALLAVSLCDPAAAKTFVKNPDSKMRGAYPAFSIGVSGLKVSIEEGLIVTVQGTVPGSPAAGKSKQGDIIVGVNGKTLDHADPLTMLGRAVTQAEAGDGKMTFLLESGKTVTVSVPVLGAYSRTWPLNCKKSNAIIVQTRKQVLASGVLDKNSLTSLIAGIFMLSTGDEKDLAAVKPMIMRVAARPTVGGGSNWPRGYEGILMAEYYLRTGDASVLPGLKKLCDGAEASQYAGGWAHGGLAREQNMGYVQGGMMNPAGAPILTALILAKECGVDVKEPMFSNALTFFYRFAGHQAVPYGDHRPEGWMSCNGKNGMLASGMCLLPDSPYHNAGELLALDMADSYRWIRAGHTGGGFDVIWRSLTAHLVPPDKTSHYRSHMQNLAWYYDLSRQSGGGFSMVGEKRYAGTGWGVGMALAYTAPLRKLRITGMPPTRLSQKVEVPDRPWGNKSDDVFTRTHHCAGFGEEKMQIHEIYKAIDAGDIAVCVKMMKHYNAVIRVAAAQKLAELKAVEELVTCVQHKDVRVRNAACMGISNDNGFFRGLDGRGRGHLSPQQVSDAFVPYFVQTLKDPNVALSETDGVLYAFSRAKPEDIRKHLDLITPWLEHEEWFLRESAFYALVGLRNTIQPKELYLLAEVFAGEAHSKPQINYAGAFGYLFNKQKVKLGDQDMKTFAQIISKQISEPQIPVEAGTPAKHQSAFKAAMVLKTMDKSAHMAARDAYAKYLKTWSVSQHSGWIISGSKWTVSMDQILVSMGKDGESLCQAMKALLGEIESGKRSLGKRPNKEIVPALRRGVENYETNYGKVTARYPQ